MCISIQKCNHKYHERHKKSYHQLTSEKKTKKPNAYLLLWRSTLPEAEKASKSPEEAADFRKPSSRLRLKGKAHHPIHPLSSGDFFPDFESDPRVGGEKFE
ncbi:unnamed protein product [Lactuca virosa]|uniref:Uncharacterized protein n=1 Tax=Lactuca virosa TaxID=75947 RepID=A0AAU9NZ71_9ASTR|nr:unnamed protein product [Lactuca virosa]